jgi:hypothetical protein
LDSKNLRSSAEIEGPETGGWPAGISAARAEGAAETAERKMKRKTKEKDRVEAVPTCERGCMGKLMGLRLGWA